MHRHTFVQSTDQSRTPLEDLVLVSSLMEAGKSMDLYATETPKRLRVAVRFPRASGKRFGEAGFWLHGTPARSLDEVLDYLDGDAHDVSKVQWFNGSEFFDLVPDPNMFAH